MEATGAQALSHKYMLKPYRHGGKVRLDTAATAAVLSCVPAYACHTISALASILGLSAVKCLWYTDAITTARDICLRLGSLRLSRKRVADTAPQQDRKLSWYDLYACFWSDVLQYSTVS